MKNTITFLFLFCVLIVESQNKTEVYIEKYNHIAVKEMDIYNIPASIKLAQAILESGSGKSRLAVEGNNHFGIKCHNNWNGDTILENDDSKAECFRKYLKVADSFRDHSLFLSEGGRYSFLFNYDKTDYENWARGLKKAGYATNPRYSVLLIDLIEKYDLGRFDTRINNKKSLYFSHSYGLPYLFGVGAYYFQDNSLSFLEVNTSFVFSGAIVGYNHNLLNNFYFGINGGAFYFPVARYIHGDYDNNSLDVTPQMSIEFAYRYKFKRNISKSILFRVGTQISLVEKDFIIPYARFTYLLD